MIDVNPSAETTLRATAGDDESIQLVDVRQRDRLTLASSVESGGIQEGSPGWWIHIRPDWPSGSGDSNSSRLAYQVKMNAEGQPAGILTAIRWATPPISIEASTGY